MSPQGATENFRSMVREEGAVVPDEERERGFPLHSGESRGER